MENQLTVKSLFNRDDVKSKFQELLGKRAPSFITSVLQIVASNSLLSKADPSSVYQSAAVAAILDLPLNNNLGFAYIVPYNESYKDADGNWKKKTVAQFQLGYKGFKQLALRSGQFLIINATDVRDGEITKHDRLSGEMEFTWIQDEADREKRKVVGYVSYFKLINGYAQTFYMSVEKLTLHGKKYSQTFKNDKGLWKDDFPAMALKTVTKLNLSKNAPLSIEMQKAIVFDQAVVGDADTQDVHYTDNHDLLLEEEITREELEALYQEKLELLNKEEMDSAKRILENKEETSYKKLYKFLNDKAA
jgi:recombination protein RecT